MISKMIYITAFSSVIVLSNVNAMEDNTNNTNKKPIILIASPGAEPRESGEGITSSKKRNGDVIDEKTTKQSNIATLSKKDNTASFPLSFLTRKKK